MSQHNHHTGGDDATYVLYKYIIVQIIHYETHDKIYKEQKVSKVCYPIRQHAHIG